uniref:argininosuccinate synthase n=1 Tax=Timema cristinae TaxID=61476 RepID=A0A7R9CFE5_TIMCR|nr:unnamed protein product [Timema cristinae]
MSEALANIGQEEDFDEAKKKATKIGAKKVIIEDLRESFVKEFVWPAVSSGLIYESRYLLGTSLARPCISLGLVQAARKEGATYVSHGATGKGNDQVRFELSCYAIWPQVKLANAFVVLSSTAEDGKIEVRISVGYESGILEDPSQAAPPEIYQMTTDPMKSPDTPTLLEITFKSGVPVSVKNLTDGKGPYTNPLEMFVYLNKVAGQNGVGRIDIVENRFLGLKSRGVYETPGGTILHQAHVDLEAFCLDREVLRLKSYLRDKMADYVYNVLNVNLYVWSIQLSQEHVTGWVRVQLYKGTALAVSRNSLVALYNQSLVSMDEHGDFEPEDATGFIKTHAIRLREFQRFKTQAANLNK